MPNDGCITNLPDDCIVEVPGYVDRNGVSIPQVGDLPPACAATLSASVNVQRMSVYAAVSADVTLLKQAVLHDPLTAAVCEPEEVWQMVDEMLIAQRKWLPQYADEISPARRRLAACRRKGTYKGTKKSKGAALLHIKTVAEMRKNRTAARRNAAASDKASARPAKAIKKTGKRT